MRTAFVCIALIAAAFLLGRQQASRIDSLESRIGHPETSRPTKVSTSRGREDETGYRSKRYRRDAVVTAHEVFERILPLVLSRKSASMGAEVALDNREAMQEILKLDSNGIRELLALIYQSEELGKPRSIGFIAPMLCLIAMADIDSSAAFTHLMENKDWKRLCPDVEGMVYYVLSRMALDDPGKALNSLRIAEESGKMRNDGLGSSLLCQVARRDPWLALENIANQPETRRNQIAQSIGSVMESDEERTAMFRALRDRRKGSSEFADQVFASLCATHDDRPDSRKWLESLGMTDEEKIEFHAAISQAMSGQSRIPLEDARWIAGFMPASPERDSMIWDRVKFTTPADDLESVMEFLHEQGIDPEVMNQREMDAR